MTRPAPLFYPTGTITSAGLARIGTARLADMGWVALVDGGTVSSGHKLRREALADAVEALRERCPDQPTE